MNKYKFTIITVCYNAQEHIEKTIKSLLEQDFSDYEYIIKDGKSTDNTMNIVRSLINESDNFHIISERDDGIYDAMNYAVERANGEYIYFLNAGDFFASTSVLKETKLFLEKKEADVVYGDVIQIRDNKKSIRRYGKVCSKKAYFLSGDCICHQAMFAKHELFHEKIFDTNYKVCADKEWQLYHINNKKIFMPMAYEIATVLVEGFSTNHLSDFEDESMRCVEKYCKNMAWIYKCICWMKHNTICVKILRRIGNIFFVRSKHE